MKTPMQELIDSIEPILTNGQFNFSYKAGIASAVTKAKRLLEKEKQCIIDAYHEGKRNHGIHTVNESEQYYTDLTNQ
jgi:hypothetical protein